MSKTICFRLSDEQHEELMRRLEGKSVSAYVKQRLGVWTAGYDPLEELRGRLDHIDQRLSELERLAAGSGY